MNENSEKLLEKATYLTEIERWNEAIPLLIKVIAQNPDHFHANCMLALCYHSLKDFENALLFAEKAVSVAPDEEWGHRLRSIVLTEQGKNKEALKAAEETARLAPYEPFALQVLANAYLGVNKPQKAQETAEKMRETAPESEYSFFTLGNVYIARGNNYEAETCFREALRLNPNFADARNNLGVAILRQKENESTFYKSSQLSLFQTEEKDEVHTHFSEAIKLEPGNKVAAENLRNQFDYLIVIYGFLFFLPFLTMALFIAPGMTIYMAFIGLIGLVQQIWRVFQKRRDITPELKMFLRASRKKPFSRTKEFWIIAERFARKTWKPHLLAALAIGFRFFYGMPKLHAKTGWNDVAAYVLLIAGLIWLVSVLRKD